MKKRVKVKLAYGRVPKQAALKKKRKLDSVQKRETSQSRQGNGE
jgi:hypothetical protein